LKEHKDAFTLVYGEYTNEQIVEAIKSGTVDATLAPKYSNDLFIKNYGVNFVIGNQPVNQSKAFILFNKKADAKLQKAVNDEMEKLKSDGTLLKLSKKYLGGDYVPKN
jgi:L-cystine transport system substrate-binding protein